MEQNTFSRIRLWCPRPLGTYSQNKQCCISVKKTTGDARSKESEASCSENLPPAPANPGGGDAAPGDGQGEEGRVMLDTWYVIKPGNTKEKIAFFVAHQCGVGGSSRSNAVKVKGNWSTDGTKPKRRRKSHDPAKGRPFAHKPKSVMSSQVRHLISLIDFQRLWNIFLVPMLIERYPGSEGIKLVRQHIQGHLESLLAQWTVELDTFEDSTPHGMLVFSNIVATLDPSARRRLVLACHYDSKYFPRDDQGRVYVGATDSAVPCSMMLELARSLDKELVKHKGKKLDLTLQMLFLDGEEALVSWTPTDSLYGSRHLAERMSRTKHPVNTASTTLIDSVDMFVLLDLLGVAKPVFLNHFKDTAQWFNRLVGIEKRLHNLGLLQLHPLEVTYFNGNTYYGPIEDDHVPFLRKGVPILHLISTPFPRVWHTMDDTAENLHPPTIENLCKILSVFLMEYLGL